MHKKAIQSLGQFFQFSHIIATCIAGVCNCLHKRKFVSFLLWDHLIWSFFLCWYSLLKVELLSPSHTIFFIHSYKKVYTHSSLTIRIASFRKKSLDLLICIQNAVQKKDLMMKMISQWISLFLNLLLVCMHVCKFSLFCLWRKHFFFWVNSHCFACRMNMGSYLLYRVQRYHS